MNLEKWQQIKDKTAALSLRERAILMAVACVVVLFIWAQVYFLNFEKELKNTNFEITQLKQQGWEQTDELASLMTRLADDPNAELLKEHSRLQAKLDELKEVIELRLSDMIAPELMVDVMRKVLSDYKGLRLISAKNLPVEPLKLDAKKQTKDQPKPEQESVLFSHRFEMVLSGDYFQTLSFLQSLESMKGFYWNLLKYEVNDYPTGKITLQLSTLSLEEEWIGV